jgi:TRAP-type C4-dicarboxylate transport system permease small subunit
MSKKIISTICLFAIFIGFLLWGGLLIFTTIRTPASARDNESFVYGALILICAFVALGAILRLPRKGQS